MKIILNYSDIRKLVKQAYNIDDFTIEFDGLEKSIAREVDHVMNVMRNYTVSSDSWTIRSDCKIAAIKALRELTNGGLCACKNAVESFPEFIRKLKENNCLPHEYNGYLIW